MKYLIGILLATSLFSNDIKKENDLLLSNMNELTLCSASYFIRTATDDKGANKFFQNAQILINGIVGEYWKEFKGSNLTNGQIRKFVDISLNSLEKTYREEKKVPDYYMNKFAKCDGILLYYIKNGESIDKNIKNPKFNKRKYLLNDLSIFNQKEVPINKDLVSKSFDIWVNTHNAMTPTKISNQLKKDTK
jgi:hypothetical protein